MPEKPEPQWQILIERVWLLPKPSNALPTVNDCWEFACPECLEMVALWTEHGVNRTRHHARDCIYANAADQLRRLYNGRRAA